MYNHETSNWAEDEIIRLSRKYGVGEYIKFVSEKGRSFPQTKTYGKYTVAYPDIENRISEKLYLLIEVKSRRDFYEQNGFLAIKQSSYNSYAIVQKNERVDVRIVYVIGELKDYKLFWCKLSEIQKIERTRRYFKDTNDKTESPYIFFHSSELSSDISELFNLLA